MWSLWPHTGPLALFLGTFVGPTKAQGIMTVSCKLRCHPYAEPSIYKVTIAENSAYAICKQMFSYGQLCATRAGKVQQDCASIHLEDGLKIHSQRRLKGWEGEIAMDEDEVQAWKWVNLAQLYDEIELQPDLYTFWLKAELTLLKAVLTRQSDS